MPPSMEGKVDIDTWRELALPKDANGQYNQCQMYDIDFEGLYLTDKENWEDAGILFTSNCLLFLNRSSLRGNITYFGKIT